MKKTIPGVALFAMVLAIALTSACYTVPPSVAAEYKTGRDITVTAHDAVQPKLQGVIGVGKLDAEYRTYMGDLPPNRVRDGKWFIIPSLLGSLEELSGAMAGVTGALQAYVRLGVDKQKISSEEAAVLQDQIETSWVSYAYITRKFNKHLKLETTLIRFLNFVASAYLKSWLLTASAADKGAVCAFGTLMDSTKSNTDRAKALQNAAKEFIEKGYAAKKARNKTLAELLKLRDPALAPAIDKFYAQYEAATGEKRAKSEQMLQILVDTFSPVLADMKRDPDEPLAITGETPNADALRNELAQTFQQACPKP